MVMIKPGSREESLYESIIKTLLEHSLEIFFLVNPDMTIYEASDLAAKMLGMTRDKLKSMRVNEIFSSEVAAKRIEYLQKALETRQPQHFVDERDGISFDNSIYPVLDAKNNVTLLVVLANDVTEYRSTVTILQETEHSLDEAQKLAQLGSWDWNPATGKIIWSGQTFHLFGWEPEDVEITYDLFISRILPKDKERVESELKSALDGSQQYESQYRILRADGEIRIHHAWGEVIREVDDKPLRVVGMVQDITEREQFAAEKQESEERYRMLVENAFDAIYLMKENHYEYVNPRFCEITGYTSEELTALDFDYNVLLPDETRTFIKDRYTARKHGMCIPSQYQVQILHKSGSLVDVEVTTVSMDEPGVVSVLGVMRDITERKRIEAELRKSESRSRAILTALPDLIFQIYKDGTILNFQGPHDQLFIPQQDFIGRKLHECLPEDVATGIYQSVQIALETGERQLYSYSLPIQGKLNRFEARMTVCGEDSIIAIVRNITEEKRQEHAQMVLYRIANAVNTTRNLSELFQFIKDVLGALIDTTNFFIALYEDETDTITLQYQVDERDEFVSFPVGRTFTSYVIKTQEPLLVTESRREGMISEGLVEPIGYPAKIWLGVPLKIEEEVKGVVVVQSYTNPDAYDEKDLDILQFVSEQIAVAIEKKGAEDALRSPNILTVRLYQVLVKV